MAHDVFISFKSDNQEVAEKICDDLSKNNIKCWISSRDIHSGEAYQSAIANALKEAAVMVLIFSSSANESEEILKEVTMAGKNRKLILPVRIEDFIPTAAFEYELSNRQYIDLFKNWEKEIEHLAKDIQYHISNLSAKGTGQQAAQQKAEVSPLAKEISNEKTYLDILTMAYADGVVSSSEKDFLARKANELGISSERAKEMEEEVKKQVVSSNDSPTANISQSETASDGDVDWPGIGHTFVKAIKASLDISLLPFKPSSVSDDKEIEQEQIEPEIAWMINDTRYFAVWLTEKRKEKITVRWGIYSVYEKRDPLFRKIIDEIYALQDKKWNEIFLVDSVKYFCPEGAGYLGVETGERKNIAEINNAAFIKHIVDNLLAFANKVCPVIEKNLVASTSSIAQSEETAGDGDVIWPSTGLTFIKAIRDSLDISRLPYKPTAVSDDKEIEEEKSNPEIDWEINDKYYFAVWLTGKRKDKIDVKWGIYSLNEKRDPLFRKTSDEMYDIPGILDQDEDIFIDGVKYFWSDEEGYLGQEADERKLIVEINNPDFIKHVIDNLLAFANKAWPVIEKNLVKV